MVRPEMHIQKHLSLAHTILPGAALNMLPPTEYVNQLEMFSAASIRFDRKQVAEMRWAKVHVRETRVSTPTYGNQ